MSSATGPVLPGQLVSTQWLADHLGADGLVVVDASVVAFTRPDGGHGGYLSGHELYLLDGHLPGAVFADLIDEFSDPDGAHPFTRPDASRFAAAAGALGVGEGTTVVVYDSAHGQWASRLWWLLRAFGYDDVAVLDGGLVKWRAEGRDTVLGHIEPTPEVFTARERAESWATKADVLAVVDGRSDASLVCAAPYREFTGEAPVRGRAGHIPGSTSAPVSRLVAKDTRTTLPVEALRETLAPVLGRRVITYCTGGIAAASAAFALTLLGEHDVAIFDGSLGEWAAEPAGPLTTLVA